MKATGKNLVQVCILFMMCFLMTEIGHATEKNSEFRLLFGDSFNNNRIQLILGNQTIVDNFNLKSDRLGGFANLSVLGYVNENSIQISSAGKNFVCAYSNDSILLQITMDGTVFKFPILLSKGSYLDLYRNSKGELKLIQNRIAPLYE
jgi:hypothetical protein